MAAKGYIAGVSANRRCARLQIVSPVNVDDMQYEIHKVFDPPKGLIEYHKTPFEEHGNDGIERQELRNDCNAYTTDIVRFHIADLKLYWRMMADGRSLVHHGRDENEEGPWTEWDLWDRQDESPCWLHGKRGVPYMGPYDAESWASSVSKAA
jgi:hypothetical protein